MTPRKSLSSSSRAVKQRSTPKPKRPAAAIYEDLLAEATSGTDLDSHDERPLKRRKAVPKAVPEAVLEVVPNAVSKGKERQATTTTRAAVSSDGKKRQAATTTADTDTADDSDIDFEDVDLDGTSPIELSSDEEIGDVHVSVGSKTQDGTLDTRRKGLSRTDKALRVLGHKAHLVALLGHGMIVNSRCNDSNVHKALRKIVTSTTRSYLRPSKTHTQFQQDRTFTMGLEKALDAFQSAYAVTATGMQRPHWQSGHEPVKITDASVLGRQDFLAAANRMSGSQDTGNQLFCAMLRSVGVQARLVYSLQVLPLANTSTALRTPPKPFKPVVFAIAPDTPLDKPDHSHLSIKDRALASARSRLGQPAFHEPAPTTPSKAKSITKLAYPVFWTEVLNDAYQKWVPVDPIVTQTIGKASKLEPPLVYGANQLVYAIAFSKDGSAKDVTRRYAKAYNAKTRRMRLECVSENDRLWLGKVLRMFATTRSDENDIEEVELAQRVGRERLPGNIQDFKGHPVYALERHLKRQEVIHPRREAGKVNAGTAANPKLEPIFRRQDVHVCRSADQWFRHGRTVKAGEQPLKLVPARVRRKESDDESDERSDTAALYVLTQTELHIPKPVVRGKVPRNAFGNLDIYVPSMIPRGGAHMRHPLAKKAAEILGIDAVDAVTGFKFVGRKGTIVTEGAIIPEQYFAAVQTTIEGLIWQEVDERSRARSALAMRLWRRYLQGLRIAERVASYATEPLLRDTGTDLTSSTAWYAAEDEPLYTAGQYTLDEIVSMDKPRKSTAPRRKQRAASAEITEDEELGIHGDEMHGGFRDSYQEDHEGGFDRDEAEQLQASRSEGGFLVDNEDVSGNMLHNEDNGGGFLIEDNNDGDIGGGFLVEDQREDRNGDQHDRDEDQYEDQHEYQQEDMAGPFPIAHHRDEQLSGGFLVDQHGGDILKGIKFDEEGREEAQNKGQPPVELTDGGSKIDEEVPQHQSQQPISIVFEKPTSKLMLQARSEAESEHEGSLLSHDPEDDDAEPDWMESD